MAEGKTKKPAAKSKSKTTKGKVKPARSTVSVSKKPIVKKVAPKKPTARKKAVVKKSNKVRKTVSQTSEAFIMPDIILPKPITLTNPANITVESVKPKRTVTTRHHIISIIALAVIGIIALFSVTSYYFVTITYIDSNAVQPLLRKPVNYVDKAFQTSAGRLAIRYPDYWEVSGIEVDAINMRDTLQGTTQAVIKVQATEAVSVVQWLKDNPPTYKNFQLAQPPEELTSRNGIYALADGETEGQKISMFYFAHENYIISVIMTYPSDDEFVEKNTTAWYAVIKGLEIQ